MGTGIETFTSERARRRWQERSQTNEDSFQRAWPDVKKERVAFGFAIAGILPTAAKWLWLHLTLNVGTAGLSPASFAISWFVGAGSGFLFWLGRRYSVIERFNCLALCTSLAFFMPVVVALIELCLSSAAADFLWLSLGAAIAGVVIAPLGLVGGWFLWRFAIRPAARPLQEIAEVF